MIDIRRDIPQFEPGQLVHHVRYNYRGVVVAVDTQCQASDEWYQRNRTQPNRNQPWYHVLVDQSTSTSYVAESNLEPDDSTEPIAHPLVPHFFREFAGGRYFRNDNPWPAG